MVSAIFERLMFPIFEKMLELTQLLVETRQNAGLGPYTLNVRGHGTKCSCVRI